MAAREARIRPYAESDQKLVLFMIGKANMQALAIANNKVYTNPLTIAIWLGLASVMIQLLGWWPAERFGWLEYLKPLPALASCAVPIMFLVDWINRPYFEDLTQEVIRHGDVRNILKYYSKPVASGFWLLEYGTDFVGLVAVDASQPTVRPPRGEDKPPKTALIRHFYVEEAYRGSNIQDDLLTHAVNHAFNSDPKLQRIEALESALIPYVRKSLRSAGFESGPTTTQVGIFKWNIRTCFLDRKKWTN